MWLCGFIKELTKVFTISGQWQRTVLPFSSVSGVQRPYNSIHGTVVT